MDAEPPGQQPFEHEGPVYGAVEPLALPQRRRMATWKKVLITVVAIPVFLVSVAFWVALAMAIENPSRANVSAPLSTTAAPTTTTVTTSTTPVTSSSAAPTTHTSTTTAAPAVASAQDRAAAAAILTASDQHYRDEFHQGQAVIGDTQYASVMDGLAAMNDPNSAAARFRDYRQNPDPERDLSSNDAFGQADSHFTADTEPQAISAWRDDLTPMTFDLNEWVTVAVSYQIRDKSQADLDAAAGKVEQDLTKLDADARAVGKG